MAEVFQSGSQQSPCQIRRVARPKEVHYLLHCSAWNKALSAKQGLTQGSYHTNMPCIPQQWHSAIIKILGPIGSLRFIPSLRCKTNGEPHDWLFFFNGQHAPPMFFVDHTIGIIVLKRRKPMAVGFPCLQISVGAFGQAWRLKPRRFAGLGSTKSCKCAFWICQLPPWFDKSRRQIWGFQNYSTIITGVRCFRRVNEIPFLFCNFPIKPPEPRPTAKRNLLGINFIRQNTKDLRILLPIF